MSSSVTEQTLQQMLTELNKAAQRLTESAARIARLNPAQAPAAPASAVGPAPGGQALGSLAPADAAPGGGVTLTPDQRLVCERVINVFETGSIRGDYGNISIFADGPNRIRQVTYGRAQTTEYGHLRELVQMYVSAGGTYARDLSAFVDRIGRTALVNDEHFKDLLRRAGREDQVMRDTQDVFFDKVYFQPAKQWADTNGFTRALSMLVIYDSFIHSGRILEFLRSRFPEPVPARGGNEQAWIKQYVDVRNHWLMTADNPALHTTVYRTRDLAREIARGNWDLAMLPISAHGVPVDTRPIAPHVVAAGPVPPGVPFLGEAGLAGGGGFPQVAGPFVAAADPNDPAAPGVGEADDLIRGRGLANYGADSSLAVSPRAAAAAGGGTLLSLDMNAARAFLRACMTSTPRVTYGLGAKVPFLNAVPGRDFTKVDCSGFIRETLRLATTPPIAFPDGSVNQHDWISAHGFTRSSIDAAKQSDGFVRIAFLRPEDSGHHIGHVVLISGGRTLESHGHVGPDSRPWDGSDWQAKAFVYVLAPDAR